jgi:hypothetical protein
MLDNPFFGTTVTVNYNSIVPTADVKIQLSNPNFKSNYQNLSDNSRILRFKLTDTIKKGDYLTTTTDGINYLVTWQPFLNINSYKSQCQICNTSITIESWQEAILNTTTGETVTPAEYIPIVNDIISFTARSSSGIFSSNANEVGIVPLGRLMVGMQYNVNTASIEIGQEFSYRNIQYKIIDVDLSQLEDSELTGVLVIYAEKLEGGRRS